MPLSSPNLDDRDFAQLVEDARQHVQRACPAWSDLSPGDPGMVLLELFAHLTEVMIYRLNRLPEKAYIEFLRLMGVRLHPPAAASVALRFSRGRGADQPIEIPRGTRVTVARSVGDGEPPVFATARAATIPPGETQVEVPAHHCELIEAELAGIGTSLPGLVVQAQRPPIVAPTGDAYDLIVGVEVTPDRPEAQAALIEHDGKVYRVWRAVDSFTNLGSDRLVYMVDRMAGTIAFAPAVRMQGEDEQLQALPTALAAVPIAGREIRLWYRRGGGSTGNVAANTLTLLKDPIPGVEAVTNPAPATGGQAAESLENALVRGPQELHSLRRAVTARDFELVALSSSRAVARARALTRSALWSHAAPGTVEVLLVPYLPEDQREGGQASAAALQRQESEPVRAQIQQTLDERRPLGTACVVSWTHYKTVRATARIVVRPHLDPATIQRRVIERLHQTINPLPTPLHTAGWPFGQALHASDIYDAALAEPGVRWVDRVRLLVDEVPEQSVTTAVADAFQPHSWYAGSGAILFRSLNDGEGWEAVGRFPGEQIVRIAAHPERAGALAVVTELPDSGGSRIVSSADCGETWRVALDSTSLKVRDIAWTLRDDLPVLLLATDAGLYDLEARPGASPLEVPVDPTNQSQAFYAVAAARDTLGQVSVAVAAQSGGGVFLSSAGARHDAFRPIGLRGEDIRVLEVQRDGPRSFLWAGAAAAGGAPGSGCFRWELRGREDPPEGWQPFGRGWAGGSCFGLAFLGTQVMAASHRTGVLRLNLAEREPAWQVPDVNCGLPLRDPGRFHPVDAVAADPAGRLVLAAGLAGVFRSDDGGATYETASRKEFADTVALPPTWLFCSGDHDVMVVSEDEAHRH